MGFENRDYARQNYGGWGPSRGSTSFRDWEVWKKLLAINIVVFILQIFVSRPMTIEEYRETYGSDLVSIPSDVVPDDSENSAENKNQTDGKNQTDNKKQADGDKQTDSEKQADSKKQAENKKQIEAQKRAAELLEDIDYLPQVSTLQKWLELDTKKVMSGQIWRLITCGFCHSRYSILHLVFNMLFLCWFGRRLEQIYGPKEFTAFYFAALLVASLAYIGLDLYTGTMVPAIGASGAVWGIVAVYAMMYPYERVYIYFLFPIQIRILALIYFLFDLHPVLLALSGERYISGVGHAAHVGGAIFGYFYWKNQWRIMPWIDRMLGKKPRWANSRRPRKDKKRSDDPAVILKMPERIDSADTKKLDAILEKISEKGREILTDEEIEFLEQKSKQLRDE